MEEEFQIVDVDTHEPSQKVEQILSAAQAALGDHVNTELRGSMIETETPVCGSLGELREELARLRRELAAAALREGARIAAGGTHPLADAERQEITGRERYHDIADTYQQLAHEQLIFGCHVHVAVGGRDHTIRTLDRTRPWLAVLKAMGTNSPFWQGRDTGYASYRTLLYDRWPVCGVPDPFGSAARYDEVVEDLEATGTVPDPSHLKWDTRLSPQHQTLEFRVFDVCTTVDETVMVAGLARSLARTCYGQAVRDEDPPQPRPEVMRVARWAAARYGVGEKLVDLTTCRSFPARDMVERFLDFLRPDLENHGEWEEVSRLVGETLQRGTGARRQREAAQRGGNLTAVVDMLVEQTMTGTG
ncbi:MAG: glutamate--cysteine ligase [Actinomycetota bacterium]|nr:glutamate--cysteine ligase [Actinomycetota bacterium]